MPGTCRIARIQRDGDLVKLAIGLFDGAQVECVVIPMRTRGNVRERITLCVSTQVGCRMGCTFCETGRMGFVRDLAPDEIVAQVAAAQTLGRRPDKIVFMGMGEPLDNLESFLSAVRLLTRSVRVGRAAPFAWSAADMTLSTVGHVEGLERLAGRFPRKMTLAVSVNAPDDAIRDRIMPVNRRWPMAALREALLAFPMRNRTFLAGYVLVPGINDAPEHASSLASWLSPFRAFVNVIALNPSSGGRDRGFRAPTVTELDRFAGWLDERGVAARRRDAKGLGLGAACGQLASCRVDGREGIRR